MQDEEKRPITRAATVLGASALGYCLGSAAVEIVARLSLSTAHLLAWRFAAGFSCALVLGLVALLTLSARPARTWRLVPIATPLALLAAFVVVPGRAHDAWGTPLLACEWPGLTVRSCEGREWGRLMGASSYQRMSGLMNVAHCREFTDGARQEETRRPVNEEEETDCPFDRAELWTETSCEEMGMAEAEQCFYCYRRVPNNATGAYAVGFHDHCSQAVVFTTWEIHISHVGECAQSIRRCM